jgi:hypothetical protein
MKNEFSLEFFKQKLAEIEKTIMEIESAFDNAEPPYLNTFLINNNFVVILKNGKQLIRSNVSDDLIQAVKNAQTEQDVINIMTCENETKIESIINEIKITQKGVNLLINTNDFYLDNGSIYMTGIKRSLPELLISEFEKVLTEYYNDNQYNNQADLDLQNHIPYQSLIRFWKKCCLNPNARSAEDLFEFLLRHNMKIDKNGNFYAYRRVVKIEQDTKLIDLISNAYIKVKSIWKKKASDFEIWYDENKETYKLLQISRINNKNLSSDFSYVGNLENLYLDLPNMHQNRYTSRHTGKEDYRVGSIISMPRHQGDDDNTINCSRGFHGSSREYNYDSFGDQDILMIISPSDVLAVPIGEIGKLRVCRWFFAMTLAENEKYILDEDLFDVTELSDIFELQLLENLKEHTYDSFAEEIQRHSFTLSAISSDEIQNICYDLASIRQVLENRIVNL